MLVKGATDVVQLTYTPDAGSRQLTTQRRTSDTKDIWCEAVGRWLHGPDGDILAAR